MRLPLKIYEQFAFALTGTGCRRISALMQVIIILISKRVEWRSLERDGHRCRRRDLGKSDLPAHRTSQRAPVPVGRTLSAAVHCRGDCRFWNCDVGLICERIVPRSAGRRVAANQLRWALDRDSFRLHRVCRDFCSLMRAVLVRVSCQKISTKDSLRLAVVPLSLRLSTNDASSCEKLRS